jgi:hypothetical protein
MLNMNELKHEDLENHATINQVISEPDQCAITDYLPKEKNDEALECETRGLDFKGNVRYFCPKCNVRYIGKLRLIFIHTRL